MEKWDKDSIIKFHEEYKGDYAGDTSSPEIIRLSKKFIGKRVLDAGAGSGALIKLIPDAGGFGVHVSTQERLLFVMEWIPPKLSGNTEVK